MTIDDKLIERVAKLSSLRISESEKEALKEELGDIVGFVENLNSLDVSNVDATFNTLEGGTQLAKDEPKSSKEISEHIIKNAPKSEDNFFIVPKIIE